MNDGDSITVRNLTKEFGKFRAVDGISFNVQRGEVFGFLGPNGAGKTTTIRILCGLLVPTGGDVRVEGYDIVKDAEKVKAIIGYMSQRFSLYGDLTVRENIEFYGGIYGVAGVEKKAGEIADFLEIGDYRDTPTAELPAGIRQRVALAASFIHHPRILFLDEPTAGVDPLLRRKFWDIIKQLSARGSTVIVTTHYMDEAENCNRIVLIDRGRIADMGSIDEIKERFVRGNIVYLELARDYMPAFRRLKDIDLPLKDISLHGSVVHLIPEAGTAGAKERVLEYCRRENIACAAAYEDRPTLEDVFINLVRRT